MAELQAQHKHRHSLGKRWCFNDMMELIELKEHCFFILRQALRYLKVCWIVSSGGKDWTCVVMEWWEARSWSSRHNLPSYLFFFFNLSNKNCHCKNHNIFREKLIWPTTTKKFNKIQGGNKDNYSWAQKKQNQREINLPLFSTYLKKWRQKLICWEGTISIVHERNGI